MTPSRRQIDADGQTLVTTAINEQTVEMISEVMEDHLCFYTTLLPTVGDVEVLLGTMKICGSYTMGDTNLERSQYCLFEYFGTDWSRSSSGPEDRHQNN